MLKQIKDIGIILSLLKKELKNYPRPFVSKWAEVRKDPFTTLISCILSLRTKDKTTADASVRLLTKHDTPEKILKLSKKQIEKLIYPVGFYRVKAKTIIEISKTLIQKYDGVVPDSLEELMELKGVGRKTANIVMAYGHFKKDYLPVDIHCHRIPNRLGWIKTKTPEESEFALKLVIPRRYWYPFNDLFVQFGQSICLPVSPWCSRCPIKGYCTQKGVKRRR